MDHLALKAFWAIYRGGEAPDFVESGLLERIEQQGQGLAQDAGPAGKRRVADLRQHAGFLARAVRAGKAGEDAYLLFSIPAVELLSRRLFGR